MKETYNYEASDGMILLGVPQELRELDYASATDMETIKQAVINGEEKPDLTPRAFNADYKEYAEITLEEGKDVSDAWKEAHPQPEPPQPEPNAEEV
jgi:hypothetical protein